MYLFLGKRSKPTLEEMYVDGNVICNSFHAYFTKCRCSW